jgi:hypothetical protein
MPYKCPCGKRANFNVPGQMDGMCCKRCKTDGMVDVKHHKCPCGKQPIYNVPGKTGGLCCKKCKTDDMIDVVNKRCPCGSQPKFNTPGEMFGMCCKKCRTGEMVDVVNKRCPCGKQPIYNVPGETVGLCCSNCMTDQMVDVVNKRCPCGNRPSFNIPGESSGIRCSKCKTDKMVDVVNKRCPCGYRPVFNVPGGSIGVCCTKCKTNEMVDVVNKICPGYNTECPIRARVSRRHMYCMSCDPNEARRKRFKRYEEDFFGYVKGKLDVHKREFRVTFDQNETSKKCARIDGIIFRDGVVVCIEVDENGHQDYECDEHRMHLVTAELLQAYPDHVVSWIRVNPMIDAKNQWSKKSKKTREKRFDDVITKVLDIIETKNTSLVYIPGV